MPRVHPSPRAARDCRVYNSGNLAKHIRIAFARQVESVLAADGVWHFEQSYMPAMLRLGSYEGIAILTVRRFIEVAGFNMS